MIQAKRGTVALVTGSDAGLGEELVTHLRREGLFTRGFDISRGNDVRSPKGECPDIDILVNNAAVNRIGWLEDFEEKDWDDVVDTNAKGIYMMTRWALPALIRNKGTILNIVSNAAHLPMTGSLAYNASKGAAHIMTLQLARELGPKYGITVFGVAPNKLAGTPMSHYIEGRVVETRGWSVEEAKAYQLQSLPAREETDPKQLAEFIAFLLSQKARHKYLQGCILPYGT